MVSLVPNSCPQGTRDKKAFSGLRILKQEFGSVFVPPDVKLSEGDRHGR